MLVATCEMPFDGEVSPVPDDDHDQPLPPSHPLSPRFEAETTSAEVETLVGFIGDAPVESRVRVYSDLTFASFYELDRADVQKAMPVDSHEEDGPTVVQVRANARIEFVRIARLAGDASYVAGNIRATYGAGLTEAVLANAVVLPTLIPVSRVFPPCGPTTRDNYCFTRGAGQAYAC
jgi:hypothetical protein